MNDIHRSRDRVEWAKTSISQRFSAANSDISTQFLIRLRLENKSFGRVANYADCIIRILKLKDDKYIKDWTRPEIESVHQIIADSDHANSVKKATLSTLKRMYHFANHNEIPDKSRGEEYDSTVSWIIPGRFEDKYNKIQSKDLLTDTEILELVRAMKIIGGKYVKRNLAILFLMLEGAYRPGELFNITIGGIEFEEDFMRVHTTGKTGPKSLALVASFQPVKDWIAEHPYGDDNDAFLLYADNKFNLMDYNEFLRLLAKARKKVNIKKHVWPYLFRHTALTEYSKTLGSIVKIYGNWSKRSNALATYEHLANSDQEDAILTKHGLKKPSADESILFFKICPSCKKRNSQDKSHCTKCGYRLMKKTVHEQQKQQRLPKEESEVLVKFQKLEQMILAQNKQMAAQDHLIKKLYQEKTTG